MLAFETAGPLRYFNTYALRLQTFTMQRLHHFAAIACLQGSLLLGNVPAWGQLPTGEGLPLPDAVSPSLDGIVDLADTDMPVGVG